MSNTGAFVTSSGQYRPKVLMFGFRDAPVIFQRRMQRIFENVRNCFVYLDDIIIASDNAAEHLEDLQNFFRAVRRANLRLHLAKCAFFQSEITFLGHQISQGEVRIDPDYKLKIAQLPKPTSRKTLMRALGFFQWLGKFIPKLSWLTRPFHILTSKNTSWKWTPLLNQQWHVLRSACLNACHTTLLHPKVTRQFRLQTDASKDAMGAVLLQFNDKLKDWAPLEFWSKSFSQHTNGWTIAEKEACAVVSAFAHWRHLLCTRTDTIVFTDHRNLIDLFLRGQFRKERLQRWALALSQYGFTACFLKGTSNIAADYLSRSQNKALLDVSNLCIHLRQPPEFITLVGNALKLPNLGWNDAEELAAKKLAEAQLAKADGTSGWYNTLLEPKLSTGDPTHWNTRVFVQAQCSDPFLGRVRAYLRDNNPRLIAILPRYLQNMCSADLLTLNSTGAIIRKDTQTLFVPPSLRTTVCSHFHDSNFATHVKKHQMYLNISRRYYWPNMKSDISTWVKHCSTCQLSARSTSDEGKTPWAAWEPKRRFEIVCVDLVGPLPLSKSGHPYILTVMDKFSRYVQAYPLEVATGLTCAAKLLLRWCALFGVPEKILSDNGSQFISEVMSSFHRLCAIKQILTTTYYPEGNGALERWHRTLKQHLRSFFRNRDEVLESGACWDIALPLIVAGYNATPHKSTNTPPWTMVFGGTYRFPSDAAMQAELDSHLNRKQSETLKSWLKRLQYYLDSRVKIAEATRTKYNVSRMKTANRGRTAEKFIVGDIVLRKHEGKVGNEYKFGPQWFGPFKIVKIYGHNNVRLQRLDGGDFIEKANMTKLKRWYDPDLRKNFFDEYNMFDTPVSPQEIQQELQLQQEAEATGPKKSPRTIRYELLLKKRKPAVDRQEAELLDQLDKDDDILRSDYDTIHKLFVRELKFELRKRGLPLSGLKAALVQRLRDWLDQNKPPVEEPEPINISQFTRSSPPPRSIESKMDVDDDDDNVWL